MRMTFICKKCKNYYKTEPCGADASQQTKEHWRSLGYTEYGLCRKCFQAELDEKNKVAKLESKKRELKPLEGSKRQVAWSNTIRLSVVKELENWEALMTERYKALDDITEAQKDRYDKDQKLIKRAHEYLKGITEAKTFIDNRNKSVDFWIDTAIENGY